MTLPAHPLRSSVLRGLLLLALPLWVTACPRYGEGGVVREDDISARDPFAGRRPTVEARKDPAADAALVRARTEARALQGAQAAEVFLVVRRAHPETTAGQEALYEAGVLYFEAKEYARARATLNELLFENPLFPQATHAKRLLGEAALESGAPRDAYQTLASLAERATGEEQRELRLKAMEAANAAGLHGAALRLAVDLAGTAPMAQREAAVAEVVRQVEGRASFQDVAEVAQGLSSGHPAWPVLTFKLARIYAHVRDFPRMRETLERLVRDAPGNPYEPQAQAMLARVSRPDRVEPKRLGVLLPLTGRYKAVGEAVLRGMKLALEGSDVALVVKDTAGDAMQAGRAVEALVLEEGVIAAVGPLLGDEARRAALVAEELGLPLLVLTHAQDISAIGPFVFRTMLSYQDEAKALADYATQELGYKSFAMLYPDIPYGTEQVNAFWDELEQRGAVVRGAESFGPDQTSYSTEAKKLVGRYYLEDRGTYQSALREAREANKGQDAFRRRKAMEKVKGGVEPIVDFEALFIPADWQTVGLIAPALAVEDVITNACDPRDLERIRKTTGNTELQTVTLLGTDQWRSPTGQSGLPALLERGGKFVTCSVYVDRFYAGSKREPTRRFVDRFREEHRALGREPFLLEAVGYDAAGMARTVMQKAKPTDRSAFRDALAGLKDFPGATGTTSFDADRNPIKPFFFLTIEAKGIRELEPAFLKKQAAGGGS